HRAERRRVVEVVVERVEAEHDPLQSVGSGNDEVAHHRAPGENFRARPRLGCDRDLEHGRSVNLAESVCAQLRPPSLRVATRPRSKPQPATGASRSARSSSARIEAKTWANIASVRTPVFVL